jgi:hypothetical protein
MKNTVDLKKRPEKKIIGIKINKKVKSEVNIKAVEGPEEKESEDEFDSYTETEDDFIVDTFMEHRFN